jgi:hypothetical protein
MLPATIPVDLQDEDVERTRRYEDREGVAYSYSVHPSGALVIWRTDAQGAEAEAVIGTAAWEEAQGDLFASLA